MQFEHFTYCEAKFTFKIEQVEQEETIVQLGEQELVLRMASGLQSEQFVAEEQLSQ